MVERKSDIGGEVMRAFSYCMKSCISDGHFNTLVSSTQAETSCSQKLSRCKVYVLNRGLQVVFHTAWCRLGMMALFELNRHHCNWPAASRRRGPVWELSVLLSYHFNVCFQFMKVGTQTTLLSNCVCAISCGCPANVFFFLQHTAFFTNNKMWQLAKTQ